MQNDDTLESKRKVVADFADFLELLSTTRAKVLATGEWPIEIPDDLKAALLRLISK